MSLLDNLKPIPALPYIQLMNFLPKEQNEEIYNYALSNQGLFVPTTTATGAEDYRISQVLYSFEPIRPYVLEKLIPLVGVSTEVLELEEFKIDQVECQLTSTLDGGFYKVHTDNGCELSKDRVLTYIYYFHKEPKPFAGGDLVIYHKGKKHTLLPRNNTIVIFPSGLSHEVRPVQSSSVGFDCARFTINGWIRKPPAEQTTGGLVGEQSQLDGAD